MIQVKYFYFHPILGPTLHQLIIVILIAEAKKKTCIKHEYDVKIVNKHAMSCHAYPGSPGPEAVMIMSSNPRENAEEMARKGLREGECLLTE